MYLTILASGKRVAQIWKCYQVQPKAQARSCKYKVRPLSQFTGQSPDQLGPWADMGMFVKDLDTGIPTTHFRQGTAGMKQGFWNHCAKCMGEGP